MVIIALVRIAFLIVISLVLSLRIMAGQGCGNFALPQRKVEAEVIVRVLKKSRPFEAHVDTIQVGVDVGFRFL